MYGVATRLIFIDYNCWELIPTRKNGLLRQIRTIFINFTLEEASGLSVTLNIDGT